MIRPILVKEFKLTYENRHETGYGYLDDSIERIGSRTYIWHLTDAANEALESDGLMFTIKLLEPERKIVNITLGDDVNTLQTGNVLFHDDDIVEPYVLIYDCIDKLFNAAFNEKQGMNEYK